MSIDHSLLAANKILQRLRALVDMSAKTNDAIPI